MSGVVISFPQGEELRPNLPPGDQIEVPEDPVSPIQEAHKVNVAGKIDQIGQLAAAGRIDGLVVVACDSRTGYFLTEICLPADQDKTDLFGLVGVIETLKSELTEQAAMAPYIDLTGTICDPNAEGAK
jgi:hypothetical protein